MNNVKPGWKTTEMWLSLAFQLLPLLTLLNVIDTSDQTSLAEAVKQIVLGVGSVLAGGGVIYAYIKSRTAVKTGV